MNTKDYLDRIKEAEESGETGTQLGRALARWKDHEFCMWKDGKWLLEGFIMYFKKQREILSAIDPSISPDLPPHLLDPVQVAHFWNIPLEELNWSPGQPAPVEGGASRLDDEYGEPPKEVGTARAARILGVSKDTLLKLKAAGLLEYRNIAPPGSSRPVYAFTLRSVMEVRTSYERDEPVPRSPTEQIRRRVSGRRIYKHLNLDD